MEILSHLFFLTIFLYINIVTNNMLIEYKLIFYCYIVVNYGASSWIDEMKCRVQIHSQEDVHKSI